MSVKQAEDKITALYERLSRDDDLAGDSSSIVNHDVLCKGRISPSHTTSWKLSAITKPSCLRCKMI